MNESMLPETTAQLLVRIRAGDGAAREHLVRRILPKLKYWAHGRLPNYLKDLQETDDLVQNTLMRALGRIEDFESRGEGAFLAYLRQILMNLVRDEINRKRFLTSDEPVEIADAGPSPSKLMVSAEQRRRYEEGLSRLPEAQSQALVMRLEFGYSYAEIAQAFSKASPDAARMMVTRAIQALARAMTP